jgi:hypothetical protein
MRAAKQRLGPDADARRQPSGLLCDQRQGVGPLQHDRAVADTAWEVLDVELDRHALSAWRGAVEALPSEQRLAVLIRYPTRRPALAPGLGAALAGQPRVSAAAPQISSRDSSRSSSRRMRFITSFDSLPSLRMRNSASRCAPSTAWRVCW